MIPVAVAGAMGRMGRRVVELIREDPVLDLVKIWESPDHPMIGKEILGLPLLSSPEEALEGVRVFVDFTRPSATLTHLEVASRMGVSAVIGTTGFETHPTTLFAPYAKKIPVFWSPNMSLGIYVLRVLLRKALSMVKGYDCEIVEAHHRYKEDAPSGTALALLEEVLKERGIPEGKVRYGRGRGKFIREVEEVGVHSIRAGEIVGDHWVLLCGQGERIELIHRALSRDPFAYGAIRVAKWIVDKKPGFYTMEDLFSGE